MSGKDEATTTNTATGVEPTTGSDGFPGEATTTNTAPGVEATPGSNSFPGCSNEATVTPEAEGRYRRKREIGKGGNGRILCAFDAHVGREIALKEILENRSAGSSARERSICNANEEIRFLREARVTGQLQHPSIVPVHEIGRRADGTLYYTMRLVKGRTLREEIRRTPFLTERLKLLPHFYDLCNAIAYAHSKGVIHRDIKPQNVMIGEYGNTVLLDWGLAKLLGKPDGASSDISVGDGPSDPCEMFMTLPGTTLGTPAYMSPEQACGKTDTVDEQSDVYSLGAVLYEILTGQPPHKGKRVAQIQMDIQEGRIKSPRSHDPAIPSELSAIALKALSREKKGRYASSLEFAKEMESYLSGEKVAAYEYSFYEYLKKTLNKHKAASAFALIAAMVLLVGSLVLVFAYRESERLREKERATRQTAQNSEANAHYGLSLALHAKAKSAFDDGDYLRSQTLAASALLQNPSFEGSPFRHPEFSQRNPESSTQRTITQSLFTQAREKTLFTLERSVWAPTQIQDFAYSNDGRLIYAGGMDGQVYAFDTASGAMQRVLKQPTKIILSVSIHPRRPLLAAGTVDSRIHLWDLESKAELAVLRGATAGVLALDFSRDGALLAGALEDGTFVVFDAESHALLAQRRIHQKDIQSIEFSKDGNLLLSASKDQSALIVEWRTGRTLQRWLVQGGAASDAVFDPTDNTVATSSWFDATILWDAHTGNKGTVFKPRPTPNLRLSFSPDGRYLASSGPGTISVFDVRARALVQSLTGYADDVPSVRFSPSGVQLAGFARDGELRIWKLRRDTRAIFLGHQSRVLASALSNDNRWLASASDSGIILVHDLLSAKIQYQFHSHDQEVRYVSFSEDGRRLVSASRDSTVRIWDLVKGGELATCRGHEGFALRAHFITDNRIFSTGADSTLRVWDATTCKQLQVLRGHNDRGLIASAWAPKQKIAATGGTDNSIILWDLVTYSRVTTLATLDDWVSDLQFVDGGTKLVSAGRDGKVLLWDVATGVLLKELAKHDKWVNTARVSADGRLLLTASDDHTVRLWDTASGELLRVLHFGHEALTLGFFGDSRQFFYVDDYSLRIGSVDREEVNQSFLTAYLRELEETAGLKLVWTNIVSTTDYRSDK